MYVVMIQEERKAVFIEHNGRKCDAVLMSQLLTPSRSQYLGVGERDPWYGGGAGWEGGLWDGDGSRSMSDPMVTP